MKKRSDFKPDIRRVLNFDLEKACQLTGIRIINNKTEIRIYSVFQLRNTSNLGLILFLVMGIFVGVVSIIKNDDVLSGIIGSLLGFGIATVSLLAIISQFTNYCIIKGNRIHIKNRLSILKFNLTPDCRVSMQSTVNYIKTMQPGSGTYYREVEIFLSSPNTGKHPIIYFQVDEKDAFYANGLGKKIIQLIKVSIQNLSDGVSPS